MNLNGSFITTFFPIWGSSQIDLGKVIRWKKYCEDKIGKDMRLQSTLEHTHSFSLFAGTIARMLDPFVFSKTRKHLNLLLLEYAFKWHDHAEGLKGRDILAREKTDKDDVEEYAIFMEHIKNLPDSIKKKYEEAFLLQFALKDNPYFTEKTRETICGIRAQYYYEALTFSALEKFEYLFYPMEMEGNHKYLLTWVIRDQIANYQRFAIDLPGFHEVLFTCELEKQFLNYLEENKDVPVPVF